MEQTPMNRELRVLMLEDTPNDAELAGRELRKTGLAFTSIRVETRDAFIRALEEFRPDIILSDYKLPDFDGMTALKIVLRDHPEVPVVMVTGVLTDIEAVEFIHAGARDYILKERLARLGPAVRRTLAAEQGIRARKRAEIIAERERIRLQTILKTASDGIHILDCDGVLVEANDAFLNMLGFDQSAIGKLRVTDWATQISWTNIKARIDDLIAHHGKVVFETHHRRSDGVVLDVEINASGIEIEGKGYVYAASRDITVRKQMEDMSRKERNFINAVLDTAGVLVVVINRDGEIVRFNRAAEEFTGYTFDEVKDRPFFWNKFLLPDQRKGVHAVFEGVKLGKVTPYYENYWLSRDGKRCLFAWANTLLPDNEDKMEFIIAVGTDITKRQQAEEELRIAATAFESQEGMVITDSSSVILRVNRAFTHITGYMAEEAIGRKINLLKSDFHDAAFYAGMWETLLQQGSWQGEIMNRRKNGEVYPEWLTITAVKGDGGEVTHYVCTLTDITLRKAAAEKQHLRELSAHLQAVREEEKTSLAREIHDDLGSTLAALKIEAHLLNSGLSAEHKTTPLFARVESMVDLLESAVAASRRIITDLRPTVLDDYGLLAAIQWQAGQFSKRTGIECRVACAFSKDNCNKNCLGGLNKTLSINLFRIFQEALTNVARHSGASRVEAEFRPGNNEVVLSIRDNGRGLPEGITIASTSFGIRGMRERVLHLGGEIGFDNLPGGGLGMTVKCPQNSNVGCPHMED
jgi:PAS domain S-box-containing protein